MQFSSLFVLAPLAALGAAQATHVSANTTTTQMTTLFLNSTTPTAPVISGTGASGSGGIPITTNGTYAATTLTATGSNPNPSTVTSNVVVGGGSTSSAGAARGTSASTGGAAVFGSGAQLGVIGAGVLGLAALL